MFTIKMKTDNDAFCHDNKESEVCRVLDYVRQMIEGGYSEGIIHDINGNNVGSWKLT